LNGTILKRKILIIDDSPTQLAITIKMISSYYEVITASTGREGLRIAMIEDPDLIILDLQMPDMNGFKVCADLKSFYPTDKTPILVYTASMNEEKIRKAFLVGASDAIMKSCSQEELLKKIENNLKKR
jgi:PleD family two-component response regulator